MKIITEQKEGFFFQTNFSFFVSLSPGKKRGGWLHFLIDERGFATGISLSMEDFYFEIIVYNT